MSNITERLLQVAAIVVIVYVGWLLYTASVQSLWSLNMRAVQAEQKLAACEAKK